MIDISRQPCPRRPPTRSWTRWTRSAHQHTELLPDLTPETIETLVDLGTDSLLVMLEMRQLGGALTRHRAELSPMGHTDARFTMNAIGVTPTAEAAGRPSAPTWRTWRAPSGRT